MTDLRKYVGIVAKRDRRQARDRAFDEGYEAALETGEPQAIVVRGMDGEMEVHFIPAPPRGKQ